MIKDQDTPKRRARLAGQTRYFTGKPCVRGHICERWVSGKCVECHYENNPLKGRPERVASKQELTSIRAKRWYEKNRQLTIDRAKKWKQENPEKVRACEERWRKKSSAKCITFMRDSLRRVLSRPKSQRTEALLGYTRDELRSHIESQFEDWMNWQNHGEWHIDHIKPISQFIIEGETRPDIINALSNLRPISAIENLKKSYKYE